MKCKFFLFTPLLVLPLLTFGQFLSTIDSLRVELSKANEDSIRYKLMGEIIQDRIYSSNPAEGLVYEKQALELGRKLKGEAGIAEVKRGIGRLHWRMGNFNSALVNHFDALKIGVKAGNKAMEMETLISIGQDYLDNTKYEEARNYLMRALAVSEEINDKKSKANIYDILIYLENQQGNFVEAAKKSIVYLQIQEELGDKSGIAHASQMLGHTFGNMGNYQEALKHFKQGLQAAKDLGDKLEQAYFNAALGDLYLTLGRLDEAETHLSEGLTLANEVQLSAVIFDMNRRMGNLLRSKDKPGEAMRYYDLAANGYKSIFDTKALAAVYSEMGIAYTHLKEYDKAAKYFDQVLAIAQGLNSIVPIAEYYIGREKLDSATGNWKNAYWHHKRFIHLKDSAFDMANLQKMIGSHLQYESDKQTAVKKAEQEKKDIRVQEELKRQRSLRNFMIAVLGIALLFSIVFYLQRNKISKEKKRSDQLLADKELLLREIHHRVKNNLEVVSSLLALQSSQIEDPNTKDAMLEGQNRVHSIGIVHQKLYQGEHLGSIEMKDYFHNLSESIIDSFGARDRVQVELLMEKIAIDIDTAVPLGLIVNELLTNSLKYAFPGEQRGHIRIRLERQTGNGLHLEVSDNGIGKASIVRGTGFGSQLISLLTHQLNGVMKEEAGNGTHVSFDFKC